MSGVSNDEKVRKLANILNVQIGRTFYHTSDLVFDGYAGRAIQHEVGLFPTAKAKSVQEGTMEAVSSILPDRILEALDFIDEHRERARKKGGSSRKSKKRKGYW